MGMKSGGGGVGGAGEIVQVQGGHIVRSTGRKDRHSKVYTAKGPRDRRVRLSAHTAIQFYDVQDRLGYDRPSKAVDWLIKKAKSSIDKLAELPPWNPIAPLTEAPQSNPNDMLIPAEETEETESSAYNFHLQRQPHNDFPPSLVSSSSINFQNFPTQHHQDLGLSLHSFPSDTTNNNHEIQTIFSSDGGGSSVGFESSYQRMVAWSNENRGGGGGFVFNSHSESEAFGGTLQSSFQPSVSTRAWNHHLHIASQTTEQQQPPPPPPPMLHQSSIFSTRFDSSSETGLPIFCIPTHVQGDQVESGVVSDHPSSTSSPNSNHH